MKHEDGFYMVGTKTNYTVLAKGEDQFLDDINRTRPCVGSSKHQIKQIHEFRETLHVKKGEGELRRYWYDYSYCEICHEDMGVSISGCKNAIDRKHKIRASVYTQHGTEYRKLECTICGCSQTGLIRPMIK
mgnify:FL=1